MLISSFLRKVVIRVAEENSVIGYYNRTEDNSERGNQRGDNLRPDFSANFRTSASDGKRCWHFYCALITK